MKLSDMNTHSKGTLVQFFVMYHISHESPLFKAFKEIPSNLLYLGLMLYLKVFHLYNHITRPLPIFDLISAIYYRVKYSYLSHFLSSSSVV